MQTYFNPDPHITEWVDLVIEKAIAVCMLSGQNCDGDLQKIKSALQKVLQTFLAEPDFTPDNLKEIIKQLLEQRVPDPLILEHIPGFYQMIDSLLDEVLAEGQTVPCLTPAAAEPIAAAETEADYAAKSISSGESIPPDSPSEPTPSDRQEEELPLSGESPAATGIKAVAEKSTEKRNPLPRKAGREEELRYLLKKLFPNAAIKWNFNIAGFNALAQADSLLLFLVQNEEEQEEIIAKLKKQGWFLAFCTEDDIPFSHRLERIIRRALRISSLV